MRKINYKIFDTVKEACDWLNKNNVSIVSINEKFGKVVHGMVLIDKFTVTVWYDDNIGFTDDAIKDKIAPDHVGFGTQIAKTIPKTFTDNIRDSIITQDSLKLDALIEHLGLNIKIVRKGNHYVCEEIKESL